MLGVRRFKSIQIDLWQGDITKFAADLSESYPKTSPSDEQDADGLKRIWTKLFKHAQIRGGRHLSINIDRKEDAIPVMNAIKECFENTDSGDVVKPIKRITLVATSMEIYDHLQEALFSSFEDLDHG